MTSMPFLLYKSSAMRPSGRMLACRPEWAYGTTSDIEMEQCAAESRYRLARWERGARSRAEDLYPYVMPATAGMDVYFREESRNHTFLGEPV